MSVNAGVGSRPAALQFPDAAAFEIWNEPNHPRFWWPTPNAAAYADFLDAADAGIKEAEAQLGQSLTMITGGAADSKGNPSAPVTYIGQADFVKQMYQNVSSTTNFDGIGVHPYPRIDAERCTSFPSGTEPYEKMQCKLDEVRSERDAAGDTGRPIWITETGVDDPSAAGAAGDLISMRISTLNSDVRAFIIHRYRDSGPDNGGIVGPEPDFVPKSIKCWIAAILGHKSTC